MYPQPAPTPAPQLLTIEEIAAQLGLENPNEIQKAATESHRSGRTTRMLLEAVQVLLQNQYVLILGHSAAYTHTLAKQTYIYAIRMGMTNVQLKEQLINYRIELFPFRAGYTKALALQNLQHDYVIFQDHYKGPGY